MSLDDLQAQLRGTLDQQFAALKQKYEDGLKEARQQAAADAERDAAVRLDGARVEARAMLEQARAEWETRCQAAAVTARADAERDLATKLEQARADGDARLRAVAAAARAEGEQLAAEAAQREREEQEKKLEQAIDQAVAMAQRGAELALESERRRGQNEVAAAQNAAKTAAEAERQRAQAELDGLRQRLQTEIAAARQVAAASPKAPAPSSATLAVSAAAFERVLAAIRDIDGARTLSEVLESLLAHAGTTAGRAALFLINGDRLKAWKAVGIPDIDVQTVESSIGGKDLLARAIQTGQPTPSSAALPAPPFARLPAERGGVAVPLMIGGRAVAVLYADSGTNAPPARSTETVETLVRHASAIAALRTAMRTLDVLGGGPPAGDGSGPGGGDVSDDQGARRYARLLVSEIKLYNEAAVRDGRQQRDLLQRLRAQIDRAQRLYEERVPPAVGSRQVYFQQELVQTLADGDPALLGKA